VRVTLQLAAGAKVPSNAVIWLMARDAGTSGGPPLAVKRVPLGAFPITVDFGMADSMMGQPLPAKMRIDARVDSHGNPMVHDPSDPAAAQDGVSQRVERYADVETGRRVRLKRSDQPLERRRVDSKSGRVVLKRRRVPSKRLGVPSKRLGVPSKRPRGAFETTRGAFQTTRSAFETTPRSFRNDFGCFRNAPSVISKRLWVLSKRLLGHFETTPGAFEITRCPLDVTLVVLSKAPVDVCK
jgi:hypothetical protein